MDFTASRSRRTRRSSRQLNALGLELVALHLLDADAAPALLKPITRYPVGGDSTSRRAIRATDKAQRRVYVSEEDAQDRQNRANTSRACRPKSGTSRSAATNRARNGSKIAWADRLTYDDLTHYQRIVVALNETIRLMAEIDAAIPAWPVC